MSRSRSLRRSQVSATGPFISFLLVASLGILMVGCGTTPAKDAAEGNSEEYRFTADDVEKFRELVKEENEKVSGTGSSAQRLTLQDGSGSTVQPINADQLALYEAIRTSSTTTGENIYRVTNEFLNVRNAPSVRAEEVARLDRGDPLTVLDFINGAWAHVQLADGTQGYVSQRYIAKLVSEENLPEEKKVHEGMYYVNFNFLNVRSEPSTGGEKLGQLDGQAFVKPISLDDKWARITFEGKEGYIAREYLAPFEPNFLVRQEKFTLPILMYDLEQEGTLDTLVRHIDSFQQEEATIITLRDFFELLVFQEERDARVDPDSLVLGIRGLTADNFTSVTDVLRASGVGATFFIESQNLGVDGITENKILTLVASGHDVQSAAHSDRDMRSLTNAEVETELQQSRFFLEEYTGDTVLAVAYPEGGVNERIMQKAYEAGYLFGVGKAPFRTFNRQELLKMPSFSVTPSMTREEVIRIVKGDS